MDMSKKITPMANLSSSLLEARQHYNHDLADKFYKHVWAGDDIFIGLGWYDDDTPTIAIACQRMVDNMVKLIISNRQLGNTRLLDLGAGYGATARYLARQYGFYVDCLNLSETQNAENRRLNHEHNLSYQIRVLQGNFESLEFGNETYHVVWSQDAFLHSDNRAAILAEIDRVLQPSGDVVFTDILQSEDCPSHALKPVLARFGLNSLATESFYSEQAIQLGWQIYEIQDISSHLVKHYWRVTHELDSSYDDLLQTFESDYLAKVRQGMTNWIKAGEQGYLQWGLFHFGTKQV
jgi:sarcosine/dimethylglycine N-methyltransferase